MKKVRRKRTSKQGTNERMKEKSRTDDDVKAKGQKKTEVKEKKIEEGNERRKFGKNTKEELKWNVK